MGTTISHFVQFHSKYDVSVVGHIQRGLPSPVLPSLNNVDQLITPAITIAVVSLSISISLAKMLSRKHTYKVSSNQVCYKEKIKPISLYFEIGIISLWYG